MSGPTPPYADESWGFGKDKQPALGMTWHAAAEYCRKKRAFFIVDIQEKERKN